MFAIREIQDVIAGTVTVTLPPAFLAKRVEVIVLSVDDIENDALEDIPSNTTQSLQALLLAAPTLTDDEVKEYENVREWMAEWRVTNY